MESQRPHADAPRHGVILPGLVGSEPPRAMLGDLRAVDHRDAETWRPAGGRITSTPADDLDALVRFDLADTARCFGLRCVATLIDAAQTRAVWSTIAEDFEARSVLTGDTSNRRLLAASAEAAEAMALGQLERAIDKLAWTRGCASSDAWVASVREERAQKGGAR
jgi:hypothetical protein